MYETAETIKVCVSVLFLGRPAQQLALPITVKKRKEKPTLLGDHNGSL